MRVFGTEPGRLCCQRWWRQAPSQWHAGQSTRCRRYQRLFVGQKVSGRKPSLSASLCHLQHQTLIQSPLWICALTGQRREVAWFQRRMASLFEGDPSVWTSVTNDSLIDEGLTTGEPQACANLSLGGSAQFGRLSRTLTTVVVSVTLVGTKSTFPKMHNPPTRLLECSLASVPPASTSHDGDGLDFQEECTATCTEGYETKSRVLALTDHSNTPPPRLDFRRCGLAVPQLRHDDRVAVF